MNRILAAMTAGATLTLAACSADGPPLVAAGVEVTAALPGSGTSAAYFELTNSSAAAIRIDRVTSPDYGSVEIHETLIDDGIARMRRLAAVTIAPGETVEFSRGGRHLMLMQPSGNLESATLDFYSGETLLLSVSARVGED